MTWLAARRCGPRCPTAPRKDPARDEASGAPLAEGPFFNGTLIPKIQLAIPKTFKIMSWSRLARPRDLVARRVLPCCPSASQKSPAGDKPRDGKTASAPFIKATATNGQQGHETRFVDVSTCSANGLLSGVELGQGTTAGDDDDRHLPGH